jgi:hypothetical protein
MNAIYSAQQEWESETTLYPLIHRLSRGKLEEEPFRRFQNAIAWLEWSEVCTIKKIETLCPKTGAATSLLSFLKKIASKHSVYIFGNPCCYPPSSPEASQSPLSQEELFCWYSRRGFIVDYGIDCPSIWYPKIPTQATTPMPESKHKMTPSSS